MRSPVDDPRDVSDSELDAWYAGEVLPRTGPPWYPVMSMGITGMCLSDADVDEAVASLRESRAHTVKLESSLSESRQRIVALEGALRSVIARVRSAGGYATPEQQDILFNAERVLAGGAK